MSSRFASLGIAVALVVSGCSGAGGGARMTPLAMSQSRIGAVAPLQTAVSSERISVANATTVTDYGPFASPKVVANVVVPYVYDVAFAADGNVYVSSQGDNAVKVFTPSGALVRSISATAPGKIGFDAQGNLYVADPTSIAVYPPNADVPARRITGLVNPNFALDSASNLLVTSGSGTYSFLSYPSGSDRPDRTVNLGSNAYVGAIATDASNYAYLAESNLGKVAVFAPSGTTPVRELTGILEPSAVLVDGSTLYVASAGSSRIELYRAGPSPVNTPFRLITQGLSKPNGLALGHDRSLFVSDFGSQMLLRYFGSDPAPADSFRIRYPTQLATDRNGEIAVASNVTDLVQLLATPATTPLHTLSNGVFVPHALAFDASGNEYVANHDSVTVYAPGNDVPVLTITDGILDPRALALDASGTLYVANGGNKNTVTVYTAGTATLARTISDGVSYPQALAFDSAGALYVANAGTNDVSAYDPATGVRIRTLSGVRLPMALVFDRFGNLYVADNAGPGAVAVYAAGATSPSRKITTGIRGPRALAFDLFGNLFVANVFGNTVTEYGPYATAPSLTFSTGISGPVALAVSAAGHLYVANSNPSGGGTVAVFGPPDTAPLVTLTNGIAAPQALALVR